MNWFVIQVQQVYAQRLCVQLNKNMEVHAFIPYLEVYLKKEGKTDLKPLFPGYIFIWSDYDQIQFDEYVRKLGSCKKGMVKELKHESVSALRPEEISVLEVLLDEQHILRMSYGQYIGKRSIPYVGPLVHFMNNIKKVDFSRNKAILDIDIFDRPISCGFIVNRYKK